MCFMALGAIASLAGTAVSAAGAIAQGNQQAALAEAQARALERQAQANQQASAFEIDKEFRQSELEMAAGRARVGASGVGFQGSPTAVLTANARQSQLDIEAIQWGGKIDTGNLRTQADISRMQGRAAKQNAMFNAAGSVFSGAAGAFSQYSQAARLGQSSSIFR